MPTLQKRIDPRDSKEYVLLYSLTYYGMTNDRKKMPSFNLSYVSWGFHGKK